MWRHACWPKKRSKRLATRLSLAVVWRRLLRKKRTTEAASSLLKLEDFPKLFIEWGRSSNSCCFLHINQWRLQLLLLLLLLLIIISCRLCERCPRAITGVESVQIVGLLSGSRIDIDMKAISSSSSNTSSQQQQQQQQRRPAAANWAASFHGNCQAVTLICGNVRQQQQLLNLIWKYGQFFPLTIPPPSPHTGRGNSSSYRVLFIATIFMLHFDGPT